MSGAWRCVVLVACAYGLDAARVLIVVPTPSISHQVVFRPVAQELTRRGHRVVILTTDPAFPPGQAPPNLTEIDLHDISYSPWIDRFLRTATGKQNDLYSQLDTAFDLVIEIFLAQMRTEAVKKLLEDEKGFDLVIAEAWTRPALALSHVFRAPVILMASLGGMDEHYAFMGAPVNPILYPDFLRTRLYNLTLWEKLTEMYSRYQIHRMVMSYEAKEDSMLREVFGTDMPPLQELKKNVELLLLNIDPMFAGYRPVPPNVIYLGSLNCGTPKQLPQMSGAWHCAVLVACAYGLDAARVLIVVPTPSVSHQVVFRPVAQELARRGHRVVILTTDPAFPPGQAPPNLTEIDLHDISYTPWIDRFLKTATGEPNDLYTQLDTLFDLMVEIFLKQMRTDAVKKLFEDEKGFDLVIAEAWTRQALALSYVFRARAILMASFGAMDEQYALMGAAVNPILYPDFLRTRLYNFTLWEKATEMYNRYQIHRMIMSYEAKENAMLREVFGADMPPLQELKKNVELLMLNIDPMFAGYRPVPPNVIYLGSLNCGTPKQLPPELQSWMDSSQHGVIYMSFGTNTDPALLPPDRMAVFGRVFAKLPYDVLWKWKDPPKGLPPNVRTSAWLPQPDLLRHKKLVLFITQAGLQSTDEALRAGVPLLAFPMLGDQWYNAEQYERLGVGKRLALATLTDQQLREAINEVIKDPGYRSRSKLLGQEMQDQPETALSRAVWWVERTLRRRGTPTRATPITITWVNFVDEDLLTAAFALLGCTFLVLFGLLRVTTRRNVKIKTN